MTGKCFRYYLSGLLLLASILYLQIESVDATSKSPYESGYDHGCDDADITNPEDRYINQPEKGTSFHTDEFMDGCSIGFNECSEGDSSDSSGSSTSNIDTFVVRITITHPENRELKYNEANIYIEEYPEYNIYVGSFSDVFHNDNPVYDSKETYEITMPSGLIDPGEEFDLCIEGLNRGMLKECHTLENSPEKGPEHITIEI